MLGSPSLGQRLDATYKLERSDFTDDRIISAVRENLSSDDPDLLEISIMRLLLRGRDVTSVERVLDHVEKTRDEEGLVFSSGVRSLTGLAHHNPEIRNKVLRCFAHLPKVDLNADNIALVLPVLESRGS